MRDGSCAKQLLHLQRQRLPEHLQPAPLSSHVVLMAWLLNNGEVSKLWLRMWTVTLAGSTRACVRHEQARVHIECKGYCAEDGRSNLGAV